MNTRSRKTKGMEFQKEVRQSLLKTFPLLELDDIRTAVSGQSGEDILFSPLARLKIPYSFLCKRQLSIGIYSAILQCESNCSKEYSPIVVFRKNRGKTYCCILFSKFLLLIK